VQGVLRMETQIDEPPRERDAAVAVLVARAKRGDVEAFTELYRRFVDRIFDYTARRLSSRQAAEDVTQEVFYRAFRGIAGCRDEDAFAGWLFAIARFVIADIHRGKQYATASLAEVADPTDPEPSPEDQVLRAERRAELQAAREHCLSARDGGKRGRR
jgi:RNA polymerase sigma-70 factor (ECF subfamily)